MSGRPITFATPAGACFGWFHRAAQPSRDTAVVLCAPLGYEALCAYRTYTQLAQALCAAGFDVLRFDYHGTGDSCGDDADAGRVQAWLASTSAAMREARRLSGARRLALFGVRFGATLAWRAAADVGGVDALVMWAPSANGRAFAREMRAAALARAIAAGATGVEALGMLFTDETLDAMARIDAPARSPAREALVIGRDDFPGEGPLPSHLRALGCDVAFEAWPGYAGMMAEPHEAVLPYETLASIVSWLSARCEPVTAQRHTAAGGPAPVRLALGSCVETPLSFGRDASLTGILAEPAAGSPAVHADTAVLLLTVGGNYRIGPNRNYVKAARRFSAAGYRCLRFDVAGIGDSRGEGLSTAQGMYRASATADVSAAIDALTQRGCRRFFLAGICSGSYLAFQTALMDARVAGIMLMNSRLLEWDAQKNGPWQSSMQRYYKSTRYYRQALLSADVYARLLRGEVDVRGIARRMSELVAARARRVWETMVLRRAPSEGVLPKFRHLAKRGVETLVLMSEQDDGLDYVEFHLGAGGSRMRGQRGFRMGLIPGADHTFSTVASQDALIEQLLAFLDGLHPSTPVPPALPSQVVMT